MPELGDLEKIIKAIASAPAHCDVNSQRDIANWLKREKSLPGFQILSESCPDFIEQSPIFHKRVYTELSTSARVVYEFGLDGSIGAAAASLGYFATIYGNKHNIPVDAIGPIEAKKGRLPDVIQHLINRASSIGAGLFAIGSQEINLWPNENAIMRIEEDLSSLLLHVKFTLSPFGIILIVPTGDMNWLTKKISLKRVCQEAGLDHIGMDPFGRIRLEWNPPVPRVQPTPLWKMPSADELSGEKGPMSFWELLKSTQEKLPPKIMLASSRSAIAKKQNSAIYTKPSPKKKSRPSQSARGNSSEECKTRSPISGLVFFQEEQSVDSEEE